MPITAELIKMARYSARKIAEKRGFVPSDAAAGGGAPPPPPGDPSMGGAPPPGDPAMGGAPPPGDPSMGGMPPPPPGDPAMGGAPPPGDPSTSMPMPPMDPSMMGGGGGDIRSIIRDELSSAGLIPGGKGGAGMNGKAPKPDINTIATDVFQLKKMFLHFIRTQGIELPPDILDGPNRDPATGAPAASPSGGSEVPPGGGMANSSIKPIEPMQGAFPPGGGGGGDGGEKGASAHRVGTEFGSGMALASRASQLSRAWRTLNKVPA
jgi:hypothetical protein